MRDARLRMAADDGPAFGLNEALIAMEHERDWPGAVADANWFVAREHPRFCSSDRSPVGLAGWKQTADSVLAFSVCGHGVGRRLIDAIVAEAPCVCGSLTPIVRPHNSIAIWDLCPRAAVKPGPHTTPASTSLSLPSASDRRKSLRLFENQSKRRFSMESATIDEVGRTSGDQDRRHRA